MKTIRSGGLLALCGLLMAGSVAAGEVAAPSPQEIAAQPEMVVAALRDRTVEASGSIVAQALAAVFAADWPEKLKRERCIALVAYAVAAKGRDAAPMMGIVAGQVPAAWLPVVAATAVVAAGNHSPAVAEAMLAALAGNAPALDACRAACADPATVLLPAEIAVIRGIMLPTPSQTSPKAPPLPTSLQPADTYEGQRK